MFKDLFNHKGFTVIARVWWFWVFANISIGTSARCVHPFAFPDLMDELIAKRELRF